MASAIRWKNAADPYTTGTTSTGRTTSIDSWGDMEFVDSLDKAMAGYPDWLANSRQCSPASSRPPYFTSTPITSAKEDSLYRYSIAASDSDQTDTITFSLITAPAGMSLTGANLTWTPRQANVGSFPVMVRASDGSLSDTATYSVQVAAYNDPPIIRTVLPDTFFVDSLYSISLVAYDEEGAALQWAILTKPDGLQLSGSALVWTPTRSQVGKDTIAITVSDGVSLDTVTSVATILSRIVRTVSHPAKLPQELCFGPGGSGFVVGIPEKTGDCARFEVMDATGRIVHSETLRSAGYFRINPGESSRGLHIVRVTAGRESLIGRIFLP
jgi:hypothetical protein